MFKLMFWDWRQSARSKGVRVLVAVWLIALAAGAVFGQIRAVEARHAAEDVRAEFQHRQAKLEADIGAADMYAVMPLSANGLIVLESPPLLDVVAGRSDLEPLTSEVNIWTMAHLMFMNHQTANPSVLALGQFDLGFVILHILPLILIVLCHSAITNERASGRDQLLRGFDVDLSRLMWARLLARSVLVLGPLLMLLGLLSWIDPVGHSERALRMFSLGTIATLYSAFWITLAALVNARSSSEGAAFQRLAAIWVVLALLIPSLLGVWARVAYPAPSRFELLAEARELEINATSRSDELLAGYVSDHPDLTIRDSETAPLWQKAIIAVTDSVDKAVAPLRLKFDGQLQQQQMLTERLQYLSPVLIAQRTMSSVSGTDETRYINVRGQAGHFLARLRSAIARMALAGDALSVERLRGLPQFQQRDPSLWSALSKLAWPCTALAGMSAGLWILSRRRFVRGTSD